MKFDGSSCMLKPVYFAFVKTTLQFFLQTTHFVKSRAHSPRPTRKIIATMTLRRAILMKADSVVSLHAHRLFSGRACSCRKDPCCHNLNRPFHLKKAPALKLVLLMSLNNLPVITINQQFTPPIFCVSTGLGRLTQNCRGKC